MDFTQTNYSKIFDKHLPKCVSLSRYLDITHLRWVILVFTRGNHIKFNYFFSSRVLLKFSSSSIVIMAEERLGTVPSSCDEQLPLDYFLSKFNDWPVTSGACSAL